MKLWRPTVRSAARRLDASNRRLALCELHTTPRRRQHPEQVLQHEAPGDGSTIVPALLQGVSQSKDPAVQEEIQAYLSRNRIRHTTAGYGAVSKPGYRPTDLLTHPPTPADLSIELLMASQTHLGHSTSLWHPANSKYIFGVREGIHILSMDITLAHIRRAANIITQVTERGGVILFVGTRKGHERVVVEAARRAGACHLFDRWIPGTITNGQQILERCGVKVVDEHDQEVKGFKDQLDGRPVLKPDLIVCLNVVDNYVMLHESGLAGIPTIGIVDTDANPSWVTYPIPANDDSFRSVAVIAGALSRAGEQGLALRKSSALRGETSFEPPANLNALVSKDDGDEDEGLGTENDDTAKAQAEEDDEGDFDDLDIEEDDTDIRAQLESRAPSDSEPASTLNEDTERLLSEQDPDGSESFDSFAVGQSTQDAPHARRNVERDNLRDNER